LHHIKRSDVHLPVLAILLAASACGGPTRPSNDAGASTPDSSTTRPAAPPTGTIKLVSASPAPGADVTVNPADKGPSLTTVFSVVFDKVLPDAFLDLELLDAAGQSCGSGAADKQNLPAGEAVQYTISSVSMKCDTPATTETLKATVFTLSATNGQDAKRTEYASGTFPAHYSFRAPAAPPAPAPPRPQSGISFVNSDPSPGSETVLAEAGGTHSLASLRMNFSVLYDTALPDAKLQVQLFDGAGGECFDAFVDHGVPAGAAETIRVDGRLLFWQPKPNVCTEFPLPIASVKATLLTLRGPEVNGRLQRTDYLTQMFSIGYTVQRYAAPPPNVPASAPILSDLSWRNESNIPTCCDPPLPDDVMNATCVAREPDGAPMTVTITVTWDAVAPKTWTQAFPAGASSSPEGAALRAGFAAPKTGKLYATLSCTATNSRGESASRSMEIGRR
jgi:hypothetical protein